MLVMMGKFRDTATKIVKFATPFSAFVMGCGFRISSAGSVSSRQSWVKCKQDVTNPSAFFLITKRKCTFLYLPKFNSYLIKTNIKAGHCVKISWQKWLSTDTIWWFSDPGFLWWNNFWHWLVVKNGTTDIVVLPTCSYRCNSYIRDVSLLSGLANFHFNTSNLHEFIPVQPIHIIWKSKHPVQVWPLTRVVPPAPGTNWSTIPYTLHIVIAIFCCKFHPVCAFMRGTSGSECITWNVNKFSFRKKSLESHPLDFYPCWNIFQH